MPVSADTLRLHLEYTTWASKRLLDAAARLSPDELARDFQTSDKTVAGTLAHIFAADRIWLSRINGSSPTGSAPGAFLNDEDRDLGRLQIAWPALLDQWKTWAAPLTDEQALDRVSYRDVKGNPHQTPIWEIVLHVVNHGTHHRGAVSGFLRAMGHTPPVLDLIAYYRTL